VKKNIYRNKNIKQRHMAHESDVIFNIPKPRQEWKDGKFVKRHEKSEESWVELFNDLVYVVLLQKLSINLNSCTFNVSTVLRIAVIFGSLCLTRQAMDEYANRFYSHDLVHKLIYLVYIGGVFVQVLNMNVVTNGQNCYDGSIGCECEYIRTYNTGLISGILLTRISIIWVYFVVMFHNEKAYLQFNVDILRWAVTCMLMIALLVLHGKEESNDLMDNVIIGSAMLIELIGWVLSRLLLRKRFTYPIDLELMQTRWGIWVMIVVSDESVACVKH
jgi:low temperature requirement protein LtrA